MCCEKTQGLHYYFPLSLFLTGRSYTRAVHLYLLATRIPSGRFLFIPPTNTSVQCNDDKIEGPLSICFFVARHPVLHFSSPPFLLPNLEVLLHPARPFPAPSSCRYTLTRYSSGLLLSRPKGRRRISPAFYIIATLLTSSNIAQIIRLIALTSFHQFVWPFLFKINTCHAAVHAVPAMTRMYRNLRYNCVRGNFAC